MPHALALGAGRRLSLRERIAWRYPEWWSLTLSGVSWIALLTGPVLLYAASPQSTVHSHPAIGLARGTALEAWLQDMTGWTLMVIAMMWPLAIGSIRVTAERSLWRRRHRAIGEFLAGSMLIWLVAGGIGAWLLTTLPVVRSAGPNLLASLALAAAAVWQLTPYKRRALRACHRTAPIAGRGWRADRDCAAYGLMMGGRCFTSCWAMMLACLLSAHSVPIMGVTTIVGVAERYSARPQTFTTAGVLTLLACLYAIAP